MPLDKSNVRTYIQTLVCIALVASVGASQVSAQAGSTVIQLEKAAPTTATEREVLTIVKQDMEAQGIDPAEATVFFGNADLNDDEEPEILVAIIHPHFLAGGGRGYLHQVYPSDDIYPILSVNANELASDCSRRSEGYCDLLVDGSIRIQFLDATYRPGARY